MGRGHCLDDWTQAWLEVELRTLFTEAESSLCEGKTFTETWWEERARHADMGLSSGDLGLRKGQKAWNSPEGLIMGYEQTLTG